MRDTFDKFSFRMKAGKIASLLSKGWSIYEISCLYHGLKLQKKEQEDEISKLKKEAVSHGETK